MLRDIISKLCSPDVWKLIELIKEIQPATWTDIVAEAARRASLGWFQHYYKGIVDPLGLLPVCRLLESDLMELESLGVIAKGQDGLYRVVKEV